MVVFFNGRLCSLAEAGVSPMDRGFLFGDGVYEVVRCYDGRWFRMEDHAARLARSLSAIDLGGFGVGSLARVGEDLLEANDGRRADAVFYLQVTRGCDGVRSHVYPKSPALKPTVFGMVRLLERGFREPPASVVLLEDQRWERCDVKSISLLGHVMAANEARARGADEAVLYRNGVITEGASVNVAAVIDGRVRTHPESPRILSGVSRKAMLEICRETNIPFEERAFGVEELKMASEVFLMGTTHEIWPVCAVDGVLLEAPAKNSVVKRLARRFTERTRSAVRLGRSS